RLHCHAGPAAGEPGAGPGSKDAAKEGFNKGLIVNGSLWMEMIKSRNQTSHTYNKNVSQKIYRQITELYFAEFVEFEKKMNLFKMRANG
ncbi:MAG TPA: nucleotidyltransferase substrate binding protein, partial [Pseudobdellovibrionaceae bacterium]|nr:nucleotidyltransferase substrate binding protein [Pseudobdellovibrionaceae bacterium]